MKRIVAYISIGLAGCKRTETFDFEDDATDEEIESVVMEWKDSHVSWGFHEESK